MATRFVFSKNPNTAGRSGPGTRRGHTVYRVRDRDPHDSQRLAPPYRGHRSTPPSLPTRERLHLDAMA